jgi:hypothetical protein
MMNTGSFAVWFTSLESKAIAWKRPRVKHIVGYWPIAYQSIEMIWTKLPFINRKRLIVM